MKLRTVSKLLAASTVVAFAAVVTANTRAGTTANATESPAEVTCTAMPTSDALAREEALYWTVGEHTFRRPSVGSPLSPGAPGLPGLPGSDTCVATLPTPTPDVSGQNKTFAGIDVDSVTGERTLGLWLSDLDGANKRLLVSHGDATGVSDPTFSTDGQAIYFTAQHPGHFELHRFDTTTATLATLVESPRAIALPVSQQMTQNADVVAVRLGSCGDRAPTDVLVSKAGEQVSLQASVSQFARRWLTPVEWRADNELVVLSRPDTCDGPGELLIVRSPMNDPRVELIAGSVTEARVQHEPFAGSRPSITLDSNFTAQS
jgi:hypothetical protein